MEEKILVKGSAEGIKFVPIILIVLGLILGIGVSYLITVPYNEEYMLPMTIGGGAILFVWGVILFFYVNNCEICVTDKRIYGKAAFGARVDIPLDSISAVGMISLLKGISVASSSGRIKFLYISNANNIHKVISDIVINRQDNKEYSTVNNIMQSISAADELKKFKELLDTGIISKEEFEVKKKQLLEL